MRAQLYMERITSYLKVKRPTATFAMPHKHFVFGSLRVNGTNGMASWRYHVALIVRLGDGKLYVLDPALSANPIEKESWYNRMTDFPSSSTITGYVTCKSNTFAPYVSCLSPERVNSEILEGYTQRYLAA